MAGNGFVSSSILFFDPQIPLGALSVDHYLGSKKRVLLFTRALFSNQQTLLVARFIGPSGCKRDLPQA
jgi:hypothetical protein